MTELFEILSRAKGLREMGDLDDAIHLYHRVLKEDPENTKALYGLALSYFDKSKKENERAFMQVAFNNLLNVIKKEPDFVQAHNLLIDIAHRLDRLGDLSKIYNSFKEKEPENPMWEENLKKIQAISLIVIPEVSYDKKKKGKGCFTKLIIDFSPAVAGVIMILLSKFYPEKFSFFFNPGIIILIAYLVFKFIFAALESKKSKSKW